MIYRMAPLSMTLNYPYLEFQGHQSQKWYEVQTVSMEY